MVLREPDTLRNGRAFRRSSSGVVLLRTKQIRVRRSSVRFAASAPIKSKTDEGRLAFQYHLRTNLQ